MIETFDHTADLGLRIRAKELNALFAESAEALFSTIVEDLTTVRPAEHYKIDISGSEHEFLLFDWLRELLYRFDAEHKLFSRFEVEVRPDGLSGSAWGEDYDAERHELNHEVKAITYHGLKVEQSADGWLAEAIVDI